MKFYTYILKCADSTYYIGKTMDIQKRLNGHNGLLPKGAKYTRTRRPVTLSYIEAFQTSSEALKREYALKQLSREEKKSLISLKK